MIMELENETQCLVKREQEKALVITAYIMMAFVAFSLVFLVYNIVRYIVPLRVKSWLIVSFYILGTIM